MGSDLRRSTLPRLDQGEPCGGELAHALSEESGITADSSTSVVYGDADSSVVQSIGWTDEKHNLYLDLLERSFVDQLNHSKRMRGSLVQEDLEGPYPSMQLPLENCASSDEFKVLQDGCWQKINFQTQRMRNTSDYHGTKSSWMRHSIPGGNAYRLQSHASLQQRTEKVHSAGKQTFSCGLASTSMQQCANHIRHPNSVGTAAEGTDQNFVDEDGKQNSAYSPEAKRVKRSSANGSSNDQVVPSGESHRTYTSACGKYASSEEHQGHPEFLPNDPD